jgi:hypothetical protein
MAFGAVLVFGGCLCLVTSCTKSETTKIESVAVRIAEDVCIEEAAKDGDVANVVRIACTVGSDIAHLVLPKAAWDEARRHPLPPQCDGGCAVP